IVTLLILMCIFFFSSRRRHTRSKRDWSSDVCSSDLINLRPIMSPTDKQSKEDMRDLLSQTFKGLKVSRNINDFCLLSLSSNKGRLVVRDYVEDSIGKIKESIETFFEYQNIIHTRL